MSLASLAPVYRYYTADLLTNEILSEIPFRGVSYERAIKGAGGFSGSIPVIADTKTLDLYESTMPGKTALYVVRDNVCVWGGIVWTRSYNVVDRILQVSASEFTSYFYHRRIWKTWSHQFGAKVTVANGVATAVFDNGSSTSLAPAATVRLDFKELNEIRFNGFYTVADTPAPTLDQFSIEDSESIATVLSVQKNSKIVSIQTEGPHGFSTGDRITLDLGTVLPSLKGTYTITAVGGSESEEFTFTQAGSDMAYRPVSGVATRPLPDGVYIDVTVSVRADTYDYIRSLVTSVFKDFVGIDFPNVYIEPGISYPFDVVEKSLDGGLASIKTSVPHNLAVGQAVQVVDLGSAFDGEYEVLETRADDRFTYAKGGTLAPTAVRMVSEDIVRVSALAGVVTVTTSAPHEVKKGQNVTISTGIELGDIGPFLNGTFKVTSIPSSTTFRYSSGVPTLVIPAIQMVDATATMLTPASRTNLITNPSFGANTTGWTAVSGPGLSPANFERTSTQSYYGPTSLAVLCDSNTNVQGIQTVAQPAKASGAYTASAYVKGFNGTKLVLSLREYNAAGVLVGTTASEVRTLDDGWVRLHSSRQMTSAANTLNFAIHYLAPAPYTFYVDAAMLTDSGDLFDYFDGDTSNDEGAQFSWTGNAQNSTSIRRTVAQVIRRSILDNKITLTTAEPSGVVVGQSVAVTGVTPAITITEKSFEQTRSRATISTATPHELQTGDTVSINGLSDSSDLTFRTVANNVVTFTTALSHNLSVGKTVSITGLQDINTVKSRALTNNFVTLGLTVPHNISVGKEVTVDGMFEVLPITGEFLYNNVAQVTLAGAHNFAVNDEIAIAGLIDTGRMVSKSVENGVAIITMSRPHNFLETDKIKITGAGSPYNGTKTILSVTTTRILFEVDTKTLMPVTASTGMVTGTNSIFNGEFVISAVGATTVSFQRAGNDVTPRFSSGGVLTAESPYNGVYTANDTPSPTAVRYAWRGNNVASKLVPQPTAEGQLPAQLSHESIHTGSRVVTSVNRNTFKFNQTVGRSVAREAVAGSVTVPSIFNGTRTITSVTDTTFEYALNAPNNVLESPANSMAYIKVPLLYNGTFTVTAVNTSTNSFTYSKTHGDMVSASVYGFGTAVVRPSTVVSSFGPFPGNSDIGIGFSTREYSGINVTPISFRGFELKNVGEALASYSDSIQGFEYRIDCAYDPLARAFTRTFVLIPIDFPDPPPAGEASPLSRFGADKLVFEYPGNIISMELEESAEDSATRFFAVGETDLGPGAGPSFGVASSEELLRGEDGRRWPLLDEDAQIKDTDDEAVLYSYAQRYLNENRPPDAKLSVTVNGSLQPEIGTYAPGDWCSLIVDDEFLRQRLASDLEPRDTVIVRKIDSMKVSVPDGTTFPEKVSLTLVPEWEVDKRGE